MTQHQRANWPRAGLGKEKRKKRKRASLKLCSYLNDVSVSHDAHVDAVDVDENVTFLQILAARPVKNRLHLLAIGAVRDRETKAHGSFRDLHREEFHFSSSAAGRASQVSSVHQTSVASILVS